MKKDTDSITIEFFKKVLAVAGMVTPNGRLYWSRKGDELLSLLKQQDSFVLVAPVQNIATYTIKPTVAVRAKTLWGRHYIHRNSANIFLKMFKKTIPACLSVAVQDYIMGIDLDSGELLSELGVDSNEDLVRSAFELSQVFQIIASHNPKNKKSDKLLTLEGKNHFPVLRSDGKVGFICVFAKIDRIRGHFGWDSLLRAGDEQYRFEKGKLFLKEDLFVEE